MRPKLTLTKEKKRKKKEVQGERKEEAIKTPMVALLVSILTTLEFLAQKKA